MGAYEVEEGLEAAGGGGIAFGTAYDLGWVLGGVFGVGDIVGLSSLSLDCSMGRRELLVGGGLRRGGLMSNWPTLLLRSCCPMYSW